MSWTHRTRPLRAQRYVASLVAFVLVLAACSGGGDDGEQAKRGRDFIKPGGATERGERGASTTGATGPGGATLGARSGKPGGAGGPGRATETAAVSGAPSSDSSSSEGGGASYQGVTDDTIKVVYFWSASQTENNPFLDAVPGANANEAQAARAWVRYVNENADRGGTIMGLPYNLHGRKLDLTVVDVGLYTEPEKNRAAAEKIVREIKPFVTFSNAGVTSIRVCPILAKAKMLQVAVGDFTFDLNKRTGGYCVAAFQTFARQVDATQEYLVNRMHKTAYEGPESGGAPVARKYGFVYSEYPDEVDSAPIVARRLRDAGLPIAKVISLSGDLATQQQQAPGAIAQLRAAGVNTVIPLDGVVPLTLTPAADSQSYFPDWYTWPCSGADFTALARLYSQTQWARASGITCTDPHYSPDLVQDDESRDSEWYRQYQTVDRSAEPPGQAPIIYGHLHTILVGITNAGPSLTPRTFLGGLERFEPKRYSFRTGVTTNPTNMLIALRERGDYSMIGDFTIIRWSPSKQRSGSRFAGAYEHPDGARRYLPHEF